MVYHEVLPRHLVSFSTKRHMCPFVRAKIILFSFLEWLHIWFMWYSIKYLFCCLGYLIGVMEKEEWQSGITSTWHNCLSHVKIQSIVTDTTISTHLLYVCMLLCSELERTKKSVNVDESTQ